MSEAPGPGGGIRKISAGADMTESRFGSGLPGDARLGPYSRVDLGGRRFLVQGRSVWIWSGGDWVEATEDERALARKTAP
jgi:hypothetical protein